MSWRKGEAVNRRRWAKVRRLVFQRDGYRCQAEGCGRAGRLECDHLVPLHVDPNQDPYNLDGLRTLCRSCHIRVTAEQNRRHDPARDAWRALVAEVSTKGV